jgi:hypothetical protein
MAERDWSKLEARAKRELARNKDKIDSTARGTPAGKRSDYSLKRKKPKDKFK